MLRNGEYIEAGKLKAGDSLMPFYRNINQHGHLNIRLNNGETQYAHRLVYRDCIGEYPEDSWTWNIHHKDRDKLNNNPDNLELLTRSEHCRVHATWDKITPMGRIKQKEALQRAWLNSEQRENRLAQLDEIRPLASKWHKSKEGREWHSKNSKGRRLAKHTLKCVVCGNEFTAKLADAMYCHPNCNATARRRREGIPVRVYNNHKVLDIKIGKVQEVYNMEVEDVHNFACNGVIVHNCDALKYFANSRESGPDRPPHPHQPQMDRYIRLTKGPKPKDLDWYNGD
jgi:hypothetical protein